MARSAAAPERSIVVVSGIPGAGKSTLARGLALRLDWASDGQSSFRALVIWLAVAYTIHNLEEWIWQPGWAPAGFEPPVGAFAFRFALVVVTASAWIVAWYASRAAPTRLAVRAGVAAAGILLLNVPFPHVLATIWFGQYAPGVVSAVAINLWLTMLVLRAALREGRVSPREAVLSTMIGGSAVLVALPVLLLMGRVLSQWTTGVGG
jgi:hypothetical protein